MKARVTILRGKVVERFDGKVLAQTTTHLFVAHGPYGEWFPITSEQVNCVVIEN